MTLSRKTALLGLLYFTTQLQTLSGTGADGEKSLYRRSGDSNSAECRHCSPGTFAIKPCFLETATVCRKCPAGFFTDQPNLLRQCQTCSACQQGFFQVRACSRTSDTVCESCASPSAQRHDAFYPTCRSSKDPDVVDLDKMASDDPSAFAAINKNPTPVSHGVKLLEKKNSASSDVGTGIEDEAIVEKDPDEVELKISGSDSEVIAKTSFPLEEDPGEGSGDGEETSSPPFPESLSPGVSGGVNDEEGGTPPPLPAPSLQQPVPEQTAPLTDIQTSDLGDDLHHDDEMPPVSASSPSHPSQGLDYEEDDDPSDGDSVGGEENIIVDTQGENKGTLGKSDDNTLMTDNTPSDNEADENTDEIKIGELPDDGKDGTDDDTNNPDDDDDDDSHDDNKDDNEEDPLDPQPTILAAVEETGQAGEAEAAGVSITSPKDLPTLVSSVSEGGESPYHASDSQPAAAAVEEEIEDENEGEKGEDSVIPISMPEGGVHLDHVPQATQTSPAGGVDDTEFDVEDGENELHSTPHSATVADSQVDAGNNGQTEFSDEEPAMKAEISPMSSIPGAVLQVAPFHLNYSNNGHDTNITNIGESVVVDNADDDDEEEKETETETDIDEDDDVPLAPPVNNDNDDVDDDKKDDNDVSMTAAVVKEKGEGVISVSGIPSTPPTSDAATKDEFYYPDMSITEHPGNETEALHDVQHHSEDDDDNVDHQLSAVTSGNSRNDTESETLVMLPSGHHDEKLVDDDKDDDDGDDDNNEVSSSSPTLVTHLSEDESSDDDKNNIPVMVIAPRQPSSKPSPTTTGRIPTLEEVDGEGEELGSGDVPGLVLDTLEQSENNGTGMVKDDQDEEKKDSIVVLAPHSGLVLGGENAEKEENVTEDSEIEKVGGETAVTPHSGIVPEGEKRHENVTEEAELKPEGGGVFVTTHSRIVLDGEKSPENVTEEAELKPEGGGVFVTTHSGIVLDGEKGQEHVTEVEDIGQEGGEKDVISLTPKSGIVLDGEKAEDNDTEEAETDTVGGVKLLTVDGQKTTRMPPFRPGDGIRRGDGSHVVVGTRDGSSQQPDGGEDIKIENSSDTEQVLAIEPAKQDGDTESDVNSKRRTAIIVGVAVGGVALFCLGFFLSRYCRKRGEFKIMKKVTQDNGYHLGNSESVEFRPVQGGSGIYDEVDEVGQPGNTGSYRRVEDRTYTPVATEPTNGLTTFTAPNGDTYAVVNKKRPPPSPRDVHDPYLNGIGHIRYIDETTDDEGGEPTPHERLLPPRQFHVALPEVVEEENKFKPPEPGPLPPASSVSGGSQASLSPDDDFKEEIDDQVVKEVEEEERGSGMVNGVTSNGVGSELSEEEEEEEVEGEARDKGCMEEGKCHVVEEMSPKQEGKNHNIITQPSVATHNGFGHS